MLSFLLLTMGAPPTVIVTPPVPVPVIVAPAVHIGSGVIVHSTVEVTARPFAPGTTGPRTVVQSAVVPNTTSPVAVPYRGLTPTPAFGTGRFGSTTTGNCPPSG